MSSRRTKNVLQNQTGLGLLEVIVGMTIMLILITPISSSLYAAIKSYQYNMAQSQNIVATRSSLNAIEDELRYATAIHNILPETTFTLPNAQNVKIAYSVGNDARSIYTIEGKSSTTNVLVIAYNGTVQKNINLSNLQSITIKRDATNILKITITTHLNNLAYQTSATITMPNIRIDS